MDEDSHIDGSDADSAREVAIDGRDPRNSLLLRCDVIDGLGHSFPCYLRNISRYGVSARGCPGLCPGEQVTIVLPVVGPVRAVVRWADKDRFGVQLETEIDPAMLKGAGAPGESARGKFEVMPQHRPMTDFRRPGLRALS